METLLLIVRWVLAFLLGGLAVLCVVQFLKDIQTSVTVKVIGGTIALFLACLAGWLVFLRWELLAVGGAALLSGVCLLFTGRWLSRRKVLQAVQELSKRTRPEPMTMEEAKERLALGDELTIMAAFQEERMGRAMTHGELQSYVTEQRENFAGFKREQKLEAEEKEQKDKKEEQEAEALEKEMETGPAGERRIRVALEKELTVSGIKGQTLQLPPGSQYLWLTMKTEDTPDAADGYPTIRTVVKNAAGSSVTLRLDLRLLVDLAEVKEAVAWRTRPEAWREAFCQAVLLEAVEGCSDSREWIEFPVDDGKVAFYSKYCPLMITLACPGTDGIWCRVHGLSHVDPDDNDENDFKPQPPFCFPLEIGKLLHLEGEEEDEEE